MHSICPAGHFCPAGSANPRGCVAGTYQNNTSAADCDICPERHYCEAMATDVLPCPAGFYCPQGTEFATEFPCPNGTYSNESSLAAASECYLCPPGRYRASFWVVVLISLAAPGLGVGRWLCCLLVINYRSLPMIYRTEMPFRLIFDLPLMFRSCFCRTLMPCF